MFEPGLEQQNAYTRREVLRTGCGLIPTVLGAQALAAPPNTQRFTTPAASASTLPSLGTRPFTPGVSEAAKSVVVHLRAREVFHGTQIHPSLAGEMVEEAVKTLTRTADAAEAWHALLRPDDRIAVKFNQVGAEALGTTVPFGLQLVESLGRAGFDPANIMLVEAPQSLVRMANTRPMRYGWSGPEVSFGSGAEQLAAWLEEVSAIINVPFLKTHNIAGMTGCLKNLSHALIRRPARYHASGCAPFVGDIIALPQIRSKLRVHIVNALQAVFDGGPEARLETMWQHHGVIVSTDPVAADSTCVDILNERRDQARLPRIGDPLGRIPHVHAAAERGVGTDDQDYITLLEPRPF